MQYADVILPLAVDGVFTYILPVALQAKVAEGSRVRVPLGRSKHYVGIVMRLHDNKPQFQCREIDEVLDAQPMLLPYQLRMWQWISDYYMSSLGDVMVAALPAGLKQTDKYKPRMEQYVTLAPAFQSEQRLRVLYGQLHRSTAQDHLLSVFLQLSHWDSLQGSSPIEPIHEVTREELLNESHATSAVLNLLVKRGALALYEKEVGRLNLNAVATDPPHPLNDIQQQALDSIGLQFEQKNAEIALTVQMMMRLKRVFGNRLGIYHSKYSDAERVEIWRKQLSAEPYDVILGARSAVFLPFQRLGLVVIDEEHESSYKQQDPAPRYHARSVAIVMAQMLGAKTLLGTATPCIETYHNALLGKYGLVTLSQRYKGVQLPQIELVDIKDLRHRKMMRGPLSPQLLSAMREALTAGEQVILFQNRRGFAQMLECPTCGWTPRCENCDVTLTYHKTTGQLVCHYCGYTCPVPSVCPACGERHLFSRGFGTEKIEDIVREEFPEARVARMDLDSTRSKNAYDRIINDFSSGRTNVLIGTQMVTKGLDFGRVTVVGILDADTMLNFPDFRAYEQAFMMMAQVSGRAGRRGKQGRVFLQTRSPELPVIHQVIAHDYKGFYHDVIQERTDFHYPPFYHLVFVYLKHRNSDVVELAAQELGNRLRQGFGARVLGPDKPSVALVKQMHIRKIVLKIENGLPLQTVRKYLRIVQNEVASDKQLCAVYLFFDVDPL